MKLTNEFLPLQLLKHISERYPNAWEYMEYVHCYAPMATALAIATQQTPRFTNGTLAYGLAHRSRPVSNPVRPTVNPKSIPHTLHPDRICGAGIGITSGQVQSLLRVNANLF